MTASPVPDAPRPRVVAFDHATRVVADLARTRRFYVDVLGMTELPRPAFSYPGAWFGFAGDDRPVLHVIEAHGPGTGRPEGEGPGSGAAGVNEDGRPKTTRGVHLALRCEDPRAFEPVLEAAGAQSVARAKTRPDGAVQVFCCDPDGHVLELCGAPA